MPDPYPVWIAQAADDAPPVIPSNTPTMAPAAPGGIPVDPNAPATAQQPASGGMEYLLLFMIGFMVLILFFSWRTQSKEKKKRDQMLASITKGAKIQTIGGILGTVTTLRDEEVVIKIDEEGGAKIKLARSAVQAVLSED
ncbi:preprotein translocase subunit YajC [Mucisphaera sp.]|uniref:preprotein translocase subunit YajC n=1 Tax=Mucisphaera sp. TaxID=2913024 RepID=UPI003D0A7326